MSQENRIASTKEVAAVRAIRKNKLRTAKTRAETRSKETRPDEIRALENVHLYSSHFTMIYFYWYDKL